MIYHRNAKGDHDDRGGIPERGGIPRREAARDPDTRGDPDTGGVISRRVRWLIIYITSYGLKYLHCFMFLFAQMPSTVERLQGCAWRIA